MDDNEGARAVRQLRALDEAVRAIGGVLEIDRVLQLIADQVRELAEAQYAAIGIVDEAGVIEHFNTSGMSDEERERIGEPPRGHGLLGLIIRENRAYRIPDIASHPLSYGFPPHHPPMHSFLGLPIPSHDAVAGRLYLTNKLGAPMFSEEDQALVERFARHAGIAIENARLHEQSRRLDLSLERERISRDLHDSVIQSIYGTTLALDLTSELIEEEPEQARAQVDEVIDTLHGVIRDLRNFIFGLRPVPVDGGTLSDGLQSLAAEFRRTGVGVSIVNGVSEETIASLQAEAVAELLAVAREALSNVVRHAQAHQVEVALAVLGNALQMEIIDDGRGFTVHSTVERGHEGLANIRTRATKLGGSCTIVSSPGAGARIIVVIPLQMVQHRGIAHV